MPVYEYHCGACGHHIDILHGFNDSGPNFCPACGAEGTMRKAFAPPTIVVKGSGWAKKERHAARSAKKSSGSVASDSSASTTPDGKGDVKPDSKSDAKSGDAAKSEPSKPAAPTGAD